MGVEVAALTQLVSASTFELSIVARYRRVIVLRGFVSRLVYPIKSGHLSDGHQPLISRDLRGDELLQVLIKMARVG